MLETPKSEILIFHNNQDYKMSLVNLFLSSNLDTFSSFYRLVTAFNAVVRDERSKITEENARKIYSVYCKDNDIMKVRAHFYIVQEEMFIDNLPDFLFVKKWSLTYRQVRTVNGLDFDLVKSALQKYIRRGETQRAIECGVELFMFQYIKGGGGEFTNFLNRLKVITIEDVGLGCPLLIHRIDSLIKRIKKGEIQALIGCIRYLCNCMHMRFYSHILAFNSKHSIVHLEYEDDEKFDLGEDEKFREQVDQLVICLSKRSIRTCYWICSIFYSDQELKTKRYRCKKAPYLVFAVIEWFFKKKKVSKDLMDLFQCCFTWFKTLKVKENILLPIHVAYVYIFQKEADITQKLLDIPENVFIQDYASNLSCATEKQFCFQDYVYDKHTKQGRIQGKTITDFVTEGALVSFDNGYFKSLLAHNFLSNYISTRFRYSQVLSETQVYTLKARAQLITRENGMDTYFASTKQKKNIVVKGPIRGYDQFYRAYSIFQIQGMFSQIHKQNVNVRMLKCDMFPFQPLGYRKQVSCKKPCYFIEFQDLFNLDSYPIIEKSSTLWKNEKVVDYTKVFAENKNLNFGIPSKLTEKGRISLIHCVAWRYIFELGDFAYRNFLCVNDQCYIIDCENVFVGKKITWKKEERVILSQVFTKYKKQITNVWIDWLQNSSGYAMNKWYMIQKTLNLSNEQVTLIQSNCKFMIKSFDSWIVS